MTPAEPAAECPSAEQLACFLEGSLAPAALAELQLHLGECDRCCSLLVELAATAAGPSEPAEGSTPAHEDRLALGRLGRYTLLERLGAGGMGVVWAAYDNELQRRVAVKLLRYDASSDDDDARRRLVREARAMARVSHPNVVAVHDVVEDHGRVFMTMELVAGRTLSSWMREQPRSWRAIVQVFVAAGHGLAAAHERGVVHRDFKPDNVMLSDAGPGERTLVRVGDFGLAHTGGESSMLTTGGEHGTDVHASTQASLVGTPAYMAPEQLAGGPVDARTDQFAFCIAMWEALFGARPFDGSSMSALAMAIAAAEVRVPGERRGVPVRVEKVLRRGLAREPAARWPTMSGLLHALEIASARPRSLRWIAAAVLGGGLVAVLAWPRPSPCASTPPWLIAAWDPSRAELVRTAASARGEAASTLAASLIATLDARHHAASEAFDASCRATFVEHTQTSDDHEARLACLQRDAAALEVIAEHAGGTDEAGLVRALRAAPAAPGIDACDEPGRARAELPWLADPVDRGRALALGIAVQQATQLRRLAEFAAAREHLAEALTLPYDPAFGAIAAAARLELAMIELREAGDGTRFHEALAEAVAAHADQVLFDTLCQLVHDAGIRRHDLPAAEAYGELALAHVATSRRGEDGHGLVMLALAQARERNGDDAGARTALLAAEAAFTAAGTLDSPRHFPLWIALGLLEENHGGLDAAEAHYDRAREVTERAWGPYHPDVAVALEYLATVRRKRGAFAEALADAQRSLAIRRAVLGARHPETAVTLGAIGAVYLEQRRWTEAEAPLAEAISIWRERGGHDRNLALAEGTLAEVELRRGEPAAALARYRDALALGERTLGDQHPELGYFLLGIGHAELGLGRPGAAIAPLERALMLLEGHEIDPVLHGKLQLRLAVAIARQHGDAARVAALLEAARADAARAPHSRTATDLVQEIDAFVGHALSTTRDDVR